MSVKNMLSYFPFEDTRDGQEDVILRIEKAFTNNKNVVMSAATGFGKSPVNICVSRWTKDRAFYTTPLKFLQTQLSDDFSNYIKVIMGRNNYTCIHDKKCTAADALCIVVDSYKCPFRDLCLYEVAKREAQDSHIMCANTSYMMVVPHESMRGGFDSRELLIVDEAHGLDEWAVSYISVMLKTSDVGDIPKLKTFSDYIEWMNTAIQKLLNKYSTLNQQLKLLKADSGHKIVVGMREERDRIVSTFSKCNRLLEDYKNNNEDWVWDFDDSGSIHFKPITSGRFLNSMLWSRAERIILSSATILSPSIYLMDIGLDINKTEIINVPSKFKPEHRPFYVMPGWKINKDTREYAIPMMAKHLSGLIGKYKGKNGLVHCHTYENASLLYDSLSDTSNVVLQDRNNRNQSLLDWTLDETPSLFLSVNFTEGINLIDDLCRYQVCLKIPYPYLGDSRVSARKAMKIYKCKKCKHEFRNVTPTCPVCLSNELHIVSQEGRTWYATKTIEAILQSYGRAVRSPTDFSDYWMYDGSFKSLYNRYKNWLFPSDFKSAIHWL